MKKAYAPRGQDYFKTTSLKKFYEIAYTVNTVVDGDIKKEAFFSTFEAMGKAYKKMKDTGAYIRNINRWDLPDDINNLGELVTDSRYHSSFTQLYDGCKLVAE